MRSDYYFLPGLGISAAFCATLYLQVDIELAIGFSCALIAVTLYVQFYSRSDAPSEVFDILKFTPTAKHHILDYVRQRMDNDLVKKAVQKTRLLLSDVTFHDLSAFGKVQPLVGWFRAHTALAPKGLVSCGRTWIKLINDPGEVKGEQKLLKVVPFGFFASTKRNAAQVSQFSPFTPTFPQELLNAACVVTVGGMAISAFLSEYPVHGDEPNVIRFLLLSLALNFFIHCNGIADFDSGPSQEMALFDAHLRQFIYFRIDGGAGKENTRQTLPGLATSKYPHLLKVLGYTNTLFVMYLHVFAEFLHMVCGWDQDYSMEEFSDLFLIMICEDGNSETVELLSYVPDGLVSCFNIFKKYVSRLLKNKKENIDVFSMLVEIWDTALPILQDNDAIPILQINEGTIFTPYFFFFTFTTLNIAKQ